MTIKGLIGASALAGLFLFSLFTYKSVDAQTTHKVAVAESNRPRGMGQNLRADYPWSGTLCIWVDDGLEWNIQGLPGQKSLVEIFQEVNNDSGLTGTEWEMHYTAGINIVGVNALGATTADSTDKMTPEQVIDLHRTGLCEIALHGTDAEISDPYTSISVGGGGEVHSPWAATQFGAVYTDSGSTEWLVKEGFDYICNTLGFIPKSYMCNGHRMDVVHRYYVNSLFGNNRSGTLFGSSTWPSSNANTGSPNNVQRGSNLEFSRNNLDPMPYMWSKYSDLVQEAHSITFPSDRGYMPHCNATDTQDCKDIAYYLAEIPALGILTWHDQNKPNGINPDMGIADVEAYIRYCAGLCNNGRLNRDKPRLQLLTMDEAMSKHSGLGFMDHSVVGVNNIKLLTGDVHTTLPWGFAPACSSMWADSGYVFIDSTTAAAAGGAFGYFNSTGTFLTNVNSDADAGTDTNFKGLRQIYQVIPGSVCTFSCLASTNRLLETGSETDSLSACYIDIKVVGPSFNWNYTDSTNTWWVGSGSASAQWSRLSSLDPWVTGANQLSSSNSSTSSSSVGYGTARIVRRFHKRDAWSYLRSQHWQGTMYNTSASDYSDDSGKDFMMRWREFNFTVQIPRDVTWVRVTYLPTGWTAATSDTLQIIPIGPFMTPQGY